MIDFRGTLRSWACASAFVAASAALIAGQAAAAAPTVAWTAIGQGAPVNLAAMAGGGKALTVDASGNVYAVGRASNALNYDALTIKYNASGGVQWRALTGGLVEAYASADAVAVDGNGNVYVAGTSVYFAEHYLTLKYDANGVEQWLALSSQDATGPEHARAIAVDGSGNVHVTGESWNGSDTDFLTIKYDAGGNEVWRVRSDGGPGLTDVATAIAVDASGNVYVTGMTGDGSSADYLTIKYDSGGTELWRVAALGDGSGEASAPAQKVDSSGNVYVSVVGLKTGTGGADYVTIKYDTNGKEQWRARSGVDTPYLFSVPAAIGTDASGNVCVTGSTLNLPAAYLTIKYDANGGEQWRATVPGTYPDDNNYAAALVIDGGGNVLVTGYDYHDSNNADGLTVKYSSNGSELWRATATGAGLSYLQAIDAGGNVYVAGYSGDIGAEDYLLIKYDTNGIEQWRTNEGLIVPQTVFGSGNGGPRRKAMTVDASGNVYMAGVSSNGSNADFLAISYDVHGIERWRATANGSGDNADHAAAVAVDASGNVYVTGDSLNNANAFDFLTIKYNANGIEQWRAVSNQANDVAAAMAVDALGNVYVTGWTAGGPNYDQYDFLTIKYGSQGIEQWRALGQGPNASVDIAEHLAIDPNGNVYVSGYSATDCLTISYDASGAERWRAHCFATTSQTRSLAVDGNGNVYVLATAYIGSYDYLTIKYDTNGVEQWRRLANGAASADDLGSSLTVDASGNVYVTGRSSNGANDDYLTIKYAPDGTELWRATVNGAANGNDRAAAIAVDAGGNVYVTGQSDPGNDDAFLTVKYDANGIEQWRVQSGDPSLDVAAYAIALGPGNSVYVAGQALGAAGPSGMIVQNIVEGPLPTVALTSSVNPSATGQGVSFTATVIGDGPRGFVDFHDGATTICSRVPLSRSRRSASPSSNATCAASALSLGVHAIVAVYSGDAHNAAATSATLVQKVIPPPPATIVLSSTIDPSSVGQSVTFNAKITGRAPTGTVEFRDGATTLCHAVPIASLGRRSGGQGAKCTTNALAAGVHPIVAVYSGDAHNGGSISNAVLQDVDRRHATTTTLTSSLNPSRDGQLLTFTATVGGQGLGGTVSFIDSGQTIAGCGSLALNGSQAMCSTSTLAVGTHSIGASYSGDADNAPSTGTLSQVVKPKR